MTDTSLPTATARDTGLLVPIVLGVLLGLAGAGNSAVAVVLPALGADLGVDEATVVWAMTIFAIGLAVSTPVYGRLADLAGVRVPLVTGLAVMSVGSALAAAAHHLPMLLAARALQGLGAGAIPVLAPAAVAAGYARPAVPLTRLGAVGVCVGSLGPLLGGVLYAASGWRAAVLAPALGALAIPVVWRGVSSRGSGGRVDATGAVLVMVSVCGLVLLVQSPSAGRTAAVVGALLLGTGLVAATAWIRARPEGFLPHSVVTEPVIARSALPGGAVPAAWFGLMLGVPLMLARLGWDPLSIGLLLLPGSLVGLIGPMLLRHRLAAADPHRRLTVACLGTALALSVTAVGGAAGSPLVMAVGMATMSFAFAVGQPAFMDWVSRSVGPDRRGVALGLASLAFLTGCSVGTAWVGGIGHATRIWLSLLLLAALPLAGAVLAASGRSIPSSQRSTP